MDFKQASDRLLELGVTLGELAQEMGGSEHVIRQARLDPSKSGYRSPPQGWREAIISLADRRGGGLRRLAKELRAVADD